MATLTRVPGPCMAMGHYKYNVQNDRILSDLALVASRTSHRLAGLADRGRWHRSRVSRVLPEHRGAYAVRSTRGLLLRFCAASAALRGCFTSISMSSNVLQRCGMRSRWIHGFLAVFARHRREVPRREQTRVDRVPPPTTLGYGPVGTRVVHPSPKVRPGAPPWESPWKVGVRKYHG